MEFLKTNYQSCRTTHHKCRQDTVELPKRVIDISANPLRLTEHAPGTLGAYAALSYRWGGWDKFTVRDTIETFRNKIDDDLLPAVFREAVSIARELGIKFLWIDSVCIVQDDRTDWIEHATKMADVYENATLVIAASSSPNPGVSFLTQTPRPVRPVPLRYQNSYDVFKARRQLACGIHRHYAPEDDDLLDNRKWAFQEKELRRRWISYSESELQWKCRTLTSCECKTRSWPTNSFLADTTYSSNVHEEWYNIVSQYTSRKLPNQEDNLPALAGLSKRFQTLTSKTYVAGLWKEQLLEDIVWGRAVEATLKPPTCYLAPTFSWASLLSQVGYQPARWQYGGTRTYHSKVVDIAISNEGDDPYTVVQDGWMMLHGPSIPAKLSASDTNDPDTYQLGVGKSQYFSDMYFDHVEHGNGFEFTIDCVLTSHDGGHKDNGGHPSNGICRATIDMVAQKSFSNVQVMLLSLYTILRPKCGAPAYENFLILGRDPNHESAYQRLGIGSGKLSSLSHQSSSIDNPGPFSWVHNEQGIDRSDSHNYSMREIRIV